MALHSFDPDVASKVGINAAVVYQNLMFWCEHNAANDRHFHDGLYWTYNSMKAFGELFPYLTSKQVRTAIEKLVDAGLVRSGNFNKSSYDRTKWYAVVHLPKRANEVAPEGEPIPDSKPEGKPSTCNNQTTPDGDGHEGGTNERARARKISADTQGQGTAELDYLIDAAHRDFREAYPDVPLRYQNESFLEREREIVAEAAEAAGDGVGRWREDVLRALRNPDFRKWLMDNRRGDWCPTLGNVLASGDWRRFSTEGKWL